MTKLILEYNFWKTWRTPFLLTYLEEGNKWQSNSKKLLEEFLDVDKI